MDKRLQIGSDISELLKVYKMTENMNHFLKRAKFEFEECSRMFFDAKSQT